MPGMNFYVKSYPDFGKGLIVRKAGSQEGRFFFTAETRRRRGAEERPSAPPRLCGEISYEAKCKN